MERTDPFTVEIIRNGLITAAEEMFISIQRTSRNPTIFEVLDHASGITDMKGRLVSQSNGVAVFCGVLPFAVQEAIQKYGLENLNEGDITITNDPYGGGGTHLSDVSLVMPVHFRGEIVAFTVNKAHWVDVGGKDLGSQTTDSTETFQEGILFPAVKLFEKGRPNQTVLDFIKYNVRVPDMALGDMHAQAASLKVASRRVIELCEKYGVDAFLESIERHIDHGRFVAGKALERLPKGSFLAEDWIDDDGLSDDSIPVKAKVTITDHEFTVDYTGTGPQTRGPTNCTLPATTCAARIIFKAITDPHEPMSEGCFAPLKVVVPEGTIFNPRRPAPTSTYWETMSYVADLVWKALAPYLPERLTAGHNLSACGTQFTGRDDRTGQIFVTNEALAGGWGAGKYKDGENALVVADDGDTYQVPAEILESRYPLMVEKYALNAVDSGSGEHRGGFGLLKDYRILNSTAYFTGIFSRSKFPPWGVSGGEDGECNHFVIRTEDGREVKGHRVAALELHAGDLVTTVSGAGGGWGNPMNRDPGAILTDVLNGYLTIEQARSKYGVVIDGNTMTISREETRMIRGPGSGSSPHSSVATPTDTASGGGRSQ